MPSGAKKRKAAKKKKENHSNNHRHANLSSSSTHSHGGEDVKHHNEKDNSVEDVSSPVAQDHQNPLTEGAEQEIEKKRNGANRPVRVEIEFEIEGKSNGKVEHDEATNKSSSSSSSSDNSSDDEVHGIKNSRATLDFSSGVDSVKVADSLSKKVENIPPADPEKGEQVKVAEKKLSYVEDKSGTSLESEKGAQDTDARLTLPNNASRATDDKGPEHDKYSPVTEPLLVPSPSPVQKTSWKSCCGLFEVFSGSGR